MLAGLGAPAFAQFETRTSFPGLSNANALAVGDFNRDGKLDFADADTNLQVFLGNGDGTFEPPANYLVGTGVIFVAAADLNHDGKLDLIVANLDGLFVLLGNGDGTFQTPAVYTTDIHSHFRQHRRLQWRSQAGSACDVQFVRLRLCQHIPRKR